MMASFPVRLLLVYGLGHSEKIVTTGAAESADGASPREGHQHQPGSQSRGAAAQAGLLEEHEAARQGPTSGGHPRPHRHGQ